MYTHPQRLSSDTQKLRNHAGTWLRELRERLGLTQRALAAQVGAQYTFISQLETGRGRVPPDRYLIWAHALEIDEREFVRTLMSYYDPVTYAILFNRAAEGQQAGMDANGSSNGSPKVTKPKVRKLSPMSLSMVFDGIRRIF